ncbi:histone-like nucleoid-structuring protein Lsr2 [Nocardia fluminea]|uniref:Lsr2 protein n=1 Tax=Nocardia fluminea TaxID=134984 RepID=A0A2N3V590_9NOCA|nr:Lsr2 family protein [Nocardia fluminea]PKV76784.1 Lsr2 protein [Nocardia fluminea]
MARKVVVTLVDDFDGTSVAEETVNFEIDGAAFEIDLSGTNAAKLRETFDQWLPYARRVGRIKSANRRSSASPAPGTSARRSDLAAIRTWAGENGHTVSSRGRISSEVIAAYDSASA